MLARYAVSTGKLKRPTACEDCGREVQLQMHHADYAKPLKVDWLCQRCHRKRPDGIPPKGPAVIKWYPARPCDNEACQEGPGGTRKTFIPNRPHQKCCSERCRYEKWAAINRRPKATTT